MYCRVIAGLLFAAVALVSGAVPAERATVAVAANFATPAKMIAEQFQQETGYEVRLSIGATGALYAQIKNGAPFDMLMAADSLRPRLLEEEGAAVNGSRFTYAVGRLVLWSARVPIEDGPTFLREANFRKLAIANPDLAPYGLAAMQTMSAMGVTDRLQGKLVHGANIGQTHTMVATGNAEAGFVARSYLVGVKEGSRWVVPAALHEPIEQDAVLLDRGRSNKAAIEFMNFLQSEETRGAIAAFGYDTPAR